ncbi:MAG: PEP-CTERM sorting domain-containing protein [Planctomycetaceae bacterium]|nr:PEP-CTERM sorting domain-containing protein [Planctomycetaceae bacterium]
MRHIVLAAALLAVYTAAPSTAHALLIDSFDSSQGGSLTASPPVSASSTLDDVTVIGGERDLFFLKSSGASPRPFSAESNFFAAGTFGVQRQSGVTGRALLQYDGEDNTAPSSYPGVTGSSPFVSASDRLDPRFGLNPTGLGGLDFTEGGVHDTFSVDVLSAAGTNILRFTVFTSALLASYLDVVVPNGTMGSVFLQYDDFVVASHLGATGAADFSNVGALTVGFTGTADADIEINLLETAVFVPEPTSLTMLGFGAVALAGYRTRRRRKLAGPAGPGPQG